MGFGTTKKRGMSTGKVKGQGDDVIASVAQCRHMQRNDIEAIGKIFAQLSRSRFDIKITVGCGDYPDIDLDRSGCANAPNFAFLEDAEKLALHLGWDITDLVQEDGATLGGFEQTLVGRIGTCEGALFMSKQLAFKQPPQSARHS
jgi:hypothetical protein